MARRASDKDELNAWADKVSGIMDEMLNRSFVPYRDSGSWQPSTNIYETQQAYIFCLELAGVAPDQIRVEFRSERRMVIRGQRNHPRPPESTQLSVHVLEIDEGPFCREVELPEAVNTREITTRYQQGYLWLTIPKLRA